jgi:hypothetical protein
VTPAAYPRVALDDRLLHRRGSALTCASALSEPGRLSPPIWPCTTRGFPCLRCCHRSGGLLPHLFTLAKLSERFEDVSQVFLRDATVLLSAGGIFSVALSVNGGTGFSPYFPLLHRLKSVPPPPWRYQARCPISSPALASLRRRCPDFPPAQPSCDDQASDYPAHPPIELYLGNWRFGGPKTRRISLVKRRVPDFPPQVLVLVQFQSVQANSGKAHTRVLPTTRPAGYSFRGKAVQTLRRQAHCKWRERG